MKIPLTLCNVLHQKARTLIAVAGVGFAILLIFVQLGFLGSAETTAIMLLGQLDYDLMLVSANYLEQNRPGSFPRSRAYQALAVEGVESVSPVYLAAAPWRITGDRDAKRNGRRRAILVVGFNPSEGVFRLAGLQAEVAKLKLTNHVLIDTQTRDYFGERRPGVKTDVGMGSIEVVGEFTLGTGYGADGMLLMSVQTFAQLRGGSSVDRVNFGLVKLRPGADPTWVAATLRAQLPADEVRVRTRHEMEQKEIGFWVNKTSVGIIFRIGVAVAWIVGTVFVYQVVSGDITYRFREYATLKAIGYSNASLGGLVCRQAVLYGLLGYVPALAGAVGVYRWVEALARIPMGMTWTRCLFVLGLTLFMCILSSFLAVGKVRRADPAELF